jgi:hypothetical protein
MKKSRAEAGLPLLSNMAATSAYLEGVPHLSGLISRASPWLHPREEAPPMPVLSSLVACVLLSSDCPGPDPGALVSWRVGLASYCVCGAVELQGPSGRQQRRIPRLVP